MRRSFPRYLRLTCLAAICLTACASMSACGSRRQPMVPVQGRVTYCGKPLKFGAVIVQPDIGPPAIGTIQSDGSFRLSTEGRDGAILGKHKVAITCYDTEAPDHIPDPKGRLGKLLIPAKYISPQTSGLKVDVKPDADAVEIKFALTDK